MSALRLRVSGIAFAFFGAACGDDVVTTDGQLSEGEARALLVSMLALQTEGADTLKMGADPDYVEIPCPMGGVFDVDGTSEGYWHGGGSSFGLHVLVTPRECRLTIGGHTYVVDGDPYLRVDLGADVAGARPVVLRGGLLGRVRWLREDGSGICLIDVDLQASVDRSDPPTPPVVGGFSGSVCGHGMDVEWDPEWTFYCWGDPACEGIPHYEGQAQVRTMR